MSELQVGDRVQTGNMYLKAVFYILEPIVSRAVLQQCSLNGFFWVKSHNFLQDLRDLRESSLLIGWETRSLTNCKITLLAIHIFKSFVIHKQLCIKPTGFLVIHIQSVCYKPVIMGNIHINTTLFLWGVFCIQLHQAARYHIVQLHHLWRNNITQLTCTKPSQHLGRTLSLCQGIIWSMQGKVLWRTLCQCKLFIMYGVWS